MVDSERTPLTARERRRAVARIALGTLQMIGAMTSLILLHRTGESALSVGTVAVTVLLMLVSLILFRGK